MVALLLCFIIIVRVGFVNEKILLCGILFTLVDVFALFMRFLCDKRVAFDGNICYNLKVLVSFMQSMK